MSMPADHTALIQRTGFPVPATAALDAAERGLLARYGYWLEALAGGELAPTTPEQAQFVRVARGEAEPRSAFEVAWVKYRRAAGVPGRAGPLEVAERLARLAAARRAATATQEEYSARRVAILEQVRAQLDALDAEFAERLAATAEEATRLEAEVRAAVLAHGAGFRHAGIQASYSRGRVTWDTPGLTAYMTTHPEVAKFRKVGAPVVSLRFRVPDDAPPNWALPPADEPRPITDGS